MGDVTARCEFELNISEYVESQSTRKVEYNFVFSGYTKYRSIRIAWIKLYFSGYAEYQSMGRSEKLSSNLILVDTRSTAVSEEIILNFIHTHVPTERQQTINGPIFMPPSMPCIILK